MNRLILVGEITQKLDDSVIMSTTEASSDGREFTEEHNVFVDKKKDMAIIKQAGDRVKIIGTLTRNEENRTIIKALEVSEHKEGESLNIARLVGIAHRTFEFYPRAEGRAAFGNLLITVDQTIYRGVAFGHMAHTLHRGCTKGSKVQLEGRLRTRSYEDRDGDMQEMIEIVADPDHTKVLKTAAIVDRFEEFEDKDKKAAI